MPATIEKIDLAELVDRCLKLYKEIQALERRKAELEQGKAIFRVEAKGRTMDFHGTGSAIARVEQKPDVICKRVEEENVPKVAKLAGANLIDLFTIHPSKGEEISFELNARKLLAKRNADSLLDLLTVPATPWVRFS